MWSTVFVVASVAATAVVVAWFLVTAKRLEASHSDERPDTPAERFYGPHPFAPAEPDAESQRAEDTGKRVGPATAAPATERAEAAGSAAATMCRQRHA